MSTAYLIDAVRTPIAKGKPGGAYTGIHPVDLHARTLAALVERVGIDPAHVDDVISGAVGQIGEQSGNTARWALLGAGFPESVPGVTVDRQCGSSQQALHFAAQGVLAGAYDVVIASGVESMSRIPIGSQSQGKNFVGSRVGDRYPDGLVPQGVSAELIAQRWNLSRTERRVRRRVAPARGEGMERRALRQPGRADHRPGDRREHPARHLRGRAGRAQAVVQGGSLGRAVSRSRVAGHRGQQLAGQ